jgi:transposase-like protein
LTWLIFREIEKKWNRFAHTVGTTWRVDETYIRVRGEWKYLYWAVDKQGNRVDLLLSRHRDIEATKRFFTRAIERQGAVEKITLDGYAVIHTAICELKETKIPLINVLVETSKYLNNPMKSKRFGLPCQAIKAFCEL